MLEIFRAQLPLEVRLFHFKGRSSVWPEPGVQDEEEAEEAEEETEEGLSQSFSGSVYVSPQAPSEAESQRAARRAVSPPPQPDFSPADDYGFFSKGAEEFEPSPPPAPAAPPPAAPRSRQSTLDAFLRPVPVAAAVPVAQALPLSPHASEEGLDFGPDAEITSLIGASPELSDL
jgi:hypothetical protein